jgi:anaerobic magnesium-protoporphyrin IX monomethyl ester cyclase
MNILILNPPRHDNILMVKEGRCMQRKGAWGYIMSPVTMVTMATLLRDCGHTVSVLDAPAEGVDFPAMLETVSRTAPEIIYINTSTPTIDDDMDAAKCIKERSNHQITTVLFGIHPSTVQLR